MSHLHSLRRCLPAMALLFLALALPAQAQPGFSAAFVPDTIGPGSVSTLRFDIDNSGGGAVRGLAFSNTLPAGMTVAAPANLVNECFGTVTAVAGGSAVSLSGGGVGAGGSCFVTVDVTSATPGAAVNTSGDLTSDAGNSGTASATLTVATDRPGFIKSFSPASVFFGGRSTLTFTIDNTSNATGAANLRFVDELPTGMVVASPVVRSNGCGGGVLTAPAGGSTITYAPAFFTDATVGAGTSCSLSVDVVANATGVLGNTTGELTSTPSPAGFERSSGKAGAELTVTLQQLSLTKEFIDDPAAPGGSVALRFTIRNLDRRSAATNLAFSDDLDAVLSGLAAVGTPLLDPCGAGSQLSGTSTLTLSGGGLPSEGSCTFTVTLAVPSGAAPGDYLNTTSAITGDVGGTPTVGNEASDRLFVQAVPVLTKTFVDDPVSAGGTVTLEFSITNTSSDAAATALTFSDALPPETPTVASLPAAGFCGPSSSATFTPEVGLTPASLTVTGASLGVGETCTFQFVLDIALGAEGGTYPNVTSAITGEVGKNVVEGDPARDDLVIVSAPRLVKEFVDDPVVAGGEVTLQFELLMSEDTIFGASDITFTDDLDATLAGLVATGLPLNDVCGAGSTLSGTMTLLLTGGNLAAGDSCIFSVTLQVPAGAAAGSYTNTTSAVSATVAGLTAITTPASDDLVVAGLSLAKEFVDDPVLPGGDVTLRYTLRNDSTTATVTDIFFTDNLDAAVDNMTGNGLPLADVCGAGSSLSGAGGDTLLVFQGGELAPGASCSFDVVLTVPASTVPDVYGSTTSSFNGRIDGQQVFLPNASDDLTVAADFLALAKEFIDDPVAPGGNVTLRFTIDNTSPTATIDAIAFSDDLDAALSGLASLSGTLAGVCGAGSEISGSGLLSFIGGELGPGASCSFDVVLAVPVDVSLGSEVINVTSDVTGSVAGLKVSGPPATDTLVIDFLEIEKSFTGTAEAGGTIGLDFTVRNLSATASVDRLVFSDDLEAVVTGLAAVGLPAADVCGEGSEISGSSLLTFSGGNLLPGGSCTFRVDLEVPAETPAGDYLNVTSDLFVDGVPVATPASAVLTVVVPDLDSDDDGVLDGDDVCPDTVIPESVPTRELRPNRYALVDADLIFDTVARGNPQVFTTSDTAGCSCEQIIEELGLGNGHRKFGCSVGAMRTWVDLVQNGGGEDEDDDEEDEEDDDDDDEDDDDGKGLRK